MDGPENNVTLSGNTWFSICLCRGVIAYKNCAFTVQVRADARLEEFIKSLGDGASLPIKRYGDGLLWQAVKEPIMIYSMDKVANNKLRNSVKFPYQLERVGLDLVGDGVDYNPITNLSFLRIVGISGPEGVTFGVTYPVSRAFAKQFSSDVVTSVKSLVQDYIAPFNIDLKLVGQY